MSDAWGEAVRQTQTLLANTYHNARTEIQPTESLEAPRFLNATDGTLAQAAELARVVASAHQGAATQMIGGEWSHACKYFSLSENYAAWADYRTPAVGFGIHAYIAQVNQPMRLTQAELKAHPAWRTLARSMASILRCAAGWRSRSSARMA